MHAFAYAPASRLLPLFFLAAALVFTGCDSNGGDLEEDDAATVQFASGGAGAVPADSIVTVPVTLSNPQGSSVSAEVLFAEQASSATRADIGDYQTQTVTFPADAEDGATQTLEFDVSEADITGGAIAAEFALQQIESDSPARIGTPREFSLNLGPIGISEAHERGVGSTVTIEGTVTRAFGSFARIQDDSGAGLVIRQPNGAFNEGIASGTIQPGTQLRLTGTLSEFNGLLQINEDDLADYTIIGQGDVPEPQTVTLAELATDGEAYESELVRVEGLTFPDASGSFSNGTSYTVEDEEGNTLTFRVQNSDESALGGVAIPSEPFTYEGVVGEFSGEYQLIPVRPSDIGGSGDDGGGEEPEVITIAEARALDNGAETTIEATITRIEGGDTVYLQDDTGGLAVFSGDLAADAGPGDRVQVTGEMDAFSGLRQLSGNVTYTVIDAGIGQPEPLAIALADVLTAPEDYESQLLEIEGLSFEESGTFEGGTNYTVSDGDGNSFDLRIPSSSFYAGEPIPEGEVTFTGVLSQFTNFGELADDEGYQLLALNEGDLEETGSGGGEAEVILAEDFQGESLGVFEQRSVQCDDVNWNASNAGTGDNFYARINEFDSENPPCEDWLITNEALALENFENEVLTFDNVKRFGSEDVDLKLKYSTDYDGEGDPTSFTWTDISDRVAWDDASGDYDFQPAGPVDLSDLPGQVYIAFHYTEADAALWELDNILVEEEGASEGEGFPTPPDRP